MRMKNGKGSRVGLLTREILVVVVALVVPLLGPPARLFLLEVQAHQVHLDHLVPQGHSCATLLHNAGPMASPGTPGHPK